MKFDLNNPRTLATTGVMAALVLGLTLIHISTTPDGGYVHLGEVAMYFAAFAFGPWVGGVAAGVGAGLADLISGYPQWAPVTLLVHGLKTLLAGWIVSRSRDRSVGWLSLAVITGGLLTVAGYFAASALLPFLGGFALALQSVIPNVIQAVTGLLGVLVYLAVLRAYPRLGRSSES